MLAMPFLFKRLGVKYMLLAGMLAWVLRYGLFAAAASTHIVWLVIGGILLHGICYDFFFVTGQIYVDKRASPKIRGQAQGFIILITQGVGMLIGAQAAGYISRQNTMVVAGKDVLNWHPIWILPCIAAAVIAGLFLILFKDDSEEPPIDIEEVPELAPA
jgi:MFS family permease